jgi:hypothetical protein
MDTEPRASAGPPPTGMPGELADAVNRVLDTAGRERAISAWAALRGRDQKLCRNYLDARHTAAWRRRRCEAVARKLAAGERPPRRLRMPRWLSTIADIASGAG